MNLARTKITRVFSSILISAYFFLLYPGCFRKDREHTDCIVALVNNKAIYSDDINLEIKKNSAEFNDPLFDIKHNVNILKKRILNSLINNELLYQEAKRGGIRVDDKEMKAFIFKLADGLTPEEFKTAEYIFDPKFKKWRELTRCDLMIQKLIDKEVSHNIEPTEEELLDYYKAHLMEFAEKKQVRARQIVVDSEIEAKEILAELRKKGDFDALAREKSLSPDSENGGDMGFFSMEQLPPEFDDVLFMLKKDEISDIVRSDYGYHIFQLLDIIDEKEPSLVESKDKIRDILIQRKKDETFQDYLKNLRAKATIKINPQALFRK